MKQSVAASLQPTDGVGEQRRAYAERRVKEFTDLPTATVWRLRGRKLFPAACRLTYCRIGYDAAAVDAWIAARLDGGLAA